MNKRGNVFFGVFVGLFLFATGVFIIPFLTDDITTTRNLLDCGNETISDGAKLMCLQTDILIPYLIWFFTSLAVGYIIGRNS